MREITLDYWLVLKLSVNVFVSSVWMDSCYITHSSDAVASFNAERF